MPYKNKEDQAECLRRWREANRDKVNAYGQYNQAKRRQRNREFVKSVKDVPCADCGVKYPSYVMDFDHLKDKEFNVARLVSECASIATLQKEIDKCEVVCANCHRERTHNRREDNGRFCR